MEKYHADISMCQIVIKGNNSEQNLKIYHNNLEIISSILTTRGNAALWNKLFKRHIIGNLRFNDKIYLGEDTLFGIEYAKRCNRGIGISNWLYHYDNATSCFTYMTDSKLLNKYLTYIESRKQMLIDTSLIDDATKKMIIGSLYQSILDSYYQARFFKDTEAQINLCDEMREALKMFPIPFKEQDKPYSFYVMAYFPRFFPIWNAISTRI